MKFTRGMMMMNIRDRIALPHMLARVVEYGLRLGRDVVITLDSKRGVRVYEA